MDRETLITHLQTSNITIEQAASVILEYCIEKGKKINLTNTLIQLLISTGQIQSYLDDAIEYYKKKFTICEVRELKTNRILLIY
jgi:hypothetical protein